MMGLDKLEKVESADLRILSGGEGEGQTCKFWSKNSLCAHLSLPPRMARWDPQEDLQNKYSHSRG